LFDLLDRHHTIGHEPKQNANPARYATLTIAPPPHSAGADVEQRGDTLLCEVETAERLVKFRRGHAPVSICPE
jgi:hypothetical protein